MNSILNNNIMQEIFSQIAKYSNDEIIITDEQFNILFHNSKFLDCEKNTSLFEVISFIINKNIKKNIWEFSNSENNHIFFKLIIKDTKALDDIPVNFHISKIKNGNNGITGYCVIISDILQEVRNKIQKATFIDIISHDLKNPMRANIRILDLILKERFGKLSDNLKPVIEELYNSCRFMKYMADNLVIKYKNEIDLYEPQMEQYSIIKLIKDTCNNTLDILKRKNQSIELIINGEKQEVNIDIKEMSKVVKSLIINASEQSLENSKIIIQTENKNKKILVSITDYGYKAKQDILDNLFDEYISCSNKFRKVGFSLDLYNCKKIIEAHHGNIYAENDTNNGTKITFSLPCM